MKPLTSGETEGTDLSPEGIAGNGAAEAGAAEAAVGSPEAAGGAAEADDHSDEPDARRAVEAELWAVVKEHLPLVIAAVSTVFIALRILAVARFDSVTAYAILQASGTAAVIFGALLSLVGQLAVITTLGLVAAYDSLSANRNRYIKNLTLAAIITAALTALWTAPINLLAIMTFSFAVDLNFAVRLWLMERRHRAVMARRDPEELQASLVRLEKALGKSRKKLDRINRRERTVLTFMAVTLALTLVNVILNTTPWLAAEHLIIKGSKPTDAYVLDESLTTMVVLTADGRRVKYFDIGSIVSRAICIEGTTIVSLETLPQLLGKPRYPSCASFDKPPHHIRSPGNHKIQQH